MRGITVVLCLGLGVMSAGCDDGHDEALARGKLVSICRGVYKTVEKIDMCNMITQRHYDLEQKYFPNEPEKVADKVLADLFPTAQENERRHNESMAQGASYKGPPPSELYEIMR